MYEKMRMTRMMRMMMIIMMMMIFQTGCLARCKKIGRERESVPDPR